MSDHIDHINYLVICRKRTALTQGDMVFLMGFTDQSNVSRCEKGEQIPSLRMILMYSIVLNISVEDLFRGHRLRLIESAKERIKARIQELSERTSSKRNRKRILYLQKILDGINKESKETNQTPFNPSDYDDYHNLVTHSPSSF